jgi:hypothetical protein
MVERFPVLLFLDRFSFKRWTDHTRTPPEHHWSVVVPILVTEPEVAAPPPGAAPQEWVFDTGNRGEAFAWRQHLLNAGLDPDALRIPGRMMITSALGGKEELPLCDVDLWLVSNLPALQGQPWRMEVHHGVPFRDVPQLPDPHFHRPLVGLRVLRRARLKVELDFAQDTISIWAPDSPSPQPGAGA